MQDSTLPAPKRRRQAGCREGLASMPEFTGERVIPGQVDADLYNEHFARYAFAARFTEGKRVLDIGCGAGYGTLELARTASTAVGIDVSLDAVSYARGGYSAPNLRYVAASCTRLPFPARSFDLAVAFEVIEHLEDWPRLLEEVRRILSPGGQFLVSTPNKRYYQESRKLHGPNPFHVHEFEPEEFSAALRTVFAHVSVFFQNHAPAIAFESEGGSPQSDLRFDSDRASQADPHFLVAICSDAPLPRFPNFVYLPKGGNVLQERELHIRRLEEELRTKDAWLDEARREHQQLLALYQQQAKDLEISNQWADQLQAELDAKARELASCVELLDKAEQTVIERTEWAMKLDKHLSELKDQLALVSASRWLRLGRALGIGPALRDQ